MCYAMGVRMDRIDFSPGQCNPGDIGRQIEGCYNISDKVRVSLLKFSENLTYLAEDGRNKKYVFRLHKPGYHTREELEGELIWLDMLKKDSGLKIAGVIPGRDGEFIQELCFEDSGLKCYCSLLEFMPGNTLRGMQGEELLYYMERIGEIAAILHNHVIAWPASAKLKRFCWDYEDLMGVDSRWGHFNEMKTLSPYQSEMYTGVSELIRFRLDRYGKSKDRYGLIHSDLNINNILVEKGSISVLDFDDCGFGWFLYDLSTSVLEYFEDSEAGSLNRLIRAWLKGYEKQRKLTAADYEEIDTFVIFRKIVRVGWIATHITNDTVKKVEPEYYQKTAQMAEEFLRKRGGL